MIDIERLEKIKEILLSISLELNCFQLTYSIHFWFGWPSQSLKISSVELIQNPKYEFMYGWGKGINEEELDVLEQQGFLKKISEVVDEQDSTEKSIEYEIIRFVK